MSPFSISRLVGPFGVWLAAVAAGVVAALALGYDLPTVAPVALILCAPALLSLMLLPFLRADWAQGLVLLIWTGFAVVASLLGGLNIMLISFLTVPVVGMLFFRGRVLEGFALGAAALAATVWGASAAGAPPIPMSEAGQTLLMPIGIAATLALAVAAMIAATESRAAQAVRADGTVRWRDGVSGGMFEFDADNRLIAANAVGRTQFGLDGVPHRSGARLTVHDLVDEEAARALLADTADTARRRRSPTEVRVGLGPSGGDYAHLDARFTPVANGGLLLHTVDRTDEEARLEALRRAQTVAEREAEDKTLFFAGVSHELRTPLNAIIGFSDMMRSRLFGPLPGKYAEYADLIHDSGQYMLDLIGDVLDLSKVEAGRYTLTKTTFDLSDVVRSSVKMIRPASDAAEVAIDVRLPEDDALLLDADRKAVRQILLNLLSNAVKFSPRGSRIEVSASSDGAFTTLSVADQGPGMSASEVSRIGEPFAQGAAGLSTDARGSGLGLSLVRQLAELHGGRLEIESTPGEGTTARVHIPETE